MSEENSSAPQQEAPSTEPAPEAPKPKKEVKKECPSPSSPDGRHSDFFNEGTEETYCRFCGRPA